MSDAKVCDQCRSVMLTNSRGESDTGEEAAWVSLSTTFASYDLCTRACVIALMDSPEFVAAMDEGLRVIAEIAGVIREGREE